MITSVLGQITGQLNQRFLLNAFFPTLLLSLLIGMVISTETGGVTAALEDWEERTTAIRLLIVIGWVAGVLVAANLVANGTLWIIQLFEGYVGPLRPFSRWGRRYQLHRATSASGYTRQTRFPVYPATLGWKDVAPTSLGNVLKSSETYAEGRYGVQAVRVWPRLYPLLPEELRTMLTEARASMEFMLVVAFFASIFTPTATVFLVYAEASIHWSLIALFGGAFVAVVAYRGAHAPAEIYGDHVRSAFDLHRFKLLKQCGAPLPSTNAEERRTWTSLVNYLDAGKAPQWRYVVADE
jgi:hypothetical protein